MHLLLRFIASSVALYLTVLAGSALHLQIWLAHGTSGIVAALLAALVLGIVNAVIRPIVKLVALPLTCLTLGLFSVVINAALFWLVGQLVPGFYVRGPIAALFGTVVMGLVGGFLNTVLVSAADKPRSRQKA